jgi:hypothetical protein
MFDLISVPFSLSLPLSFSWIGILIWASHLQLSSQPLLRCQKPPVTEPLQA